MIAAALLGKNGVILSPSKSSAYVKLNILKENFRYVVNCYSFTVVPVKKVLLVNIFGGAVIIIFSFTSILLLYAVLRYFDLHRVTLREEKLGTYYENELSYLHNCITNTTMQLGLDLAIHNQAAYYMDDEMKRIDSMETISKKKCDAIN